MASSFQTVLLLLAFLISGIASAMMGKVQYGLESRGLVGKKAFTKPWFLTFNKLLGMFTVLIWVRLFRCCRCSKSGKHQEIQDQQKSVEDGNSSSSVSIRVEPSMTMKKLLLMAVPAFFDILATALGAIGMLYIPVSVCQMLQGTSLVFIAAFSTYFLKQRLFAFNWLGMLLCVLGVSTVGFASLMTEADKAGSEGHAARKTHVLVGMSLTIGAQFVQAAQVFAEEYLMKDLDVSSLDVVGYKGFWGVAQMIVIVFPILYFLPGDDVVSQENTFDTLVMIHNSLPLLTAVLADRFSCLVLNVTGMLIIKQFSAVHMMMIDASRTTLVWIFDLSVYYAIDESSSLAECWTHWSVLQLIGFSIQLVGQAIYSQVLRIPCLKYDQAVKEREEQ
mmetsp:Transcript_12039/g.21359  ORF Transcript_12039/g.21359 Transcript_12039/m.21359 type:complete len:390 (+) Transcript_12039:74-1243(+)